MPEKNEASRNVRIQDVAAAAGVSVSTVSNVLNKPHLVQEDTLELVAGVMKGLDYRPNTHAVALRRDNGRRTPEPFPHPTQPGTVLPEPPGAKKAKFVENGTAAPWNHLRAGDRVQVHAARQGDYEGVIDAIMPDFSALWLWRLDGMGRELILAEDDPRQVLWDASLQNRTTVADRPGAES